MSLASIFKPRSNSTSSYVARQRLNNVLVTDRLRVSPETMQLIKQGIKDSINRYVEINEEDIELILKNDSGNVMLSTNVPVKKVKRHQS